MEGRELRRILDAHQLIARAYKDDRFPTSGRGGDFRMFVITWIWIVAIERCPKDDRWKRAASILGLRNNFQLRELIASDAPRYEPEDRGAWYAPCPAPMIRRSGLCERRGTIRVRVTNPDDGTWRPDWYCSRHRDVANQVQEHERALLASGKVPEPLPNRGGLGPSYLRWKWANVYRWAAGASWEPPSVGLCADDWPVMAKVLGRQAAPELAVLDGDGEASGWPGGAPGLRLVQGGDDHG
ncbi:hypothetical protein [Nonomuraea sp. SYSU D8015]|uniref:hypothetical protein n=1 Tax=Nonomuraea sp. SYSU D8015 TaxID=2593644 RepID=UPI0016603561|nr:hypothetical protein [Nonomuraea sp. SYSU D8015]